MLARFDICRQKGFDAIAISLTATTVTPDCPLTTLGQLVYDCTLVDPVPISDGMSILLKKQFGQVINLFRRIHISTERTMRGVRRLPKATPFTRGGKAVFHIEHNLQMMTSTCKQSHHFSSMRKIKPRRQPLVC